MSVQDSLSAVEEGPRKKTRGEVFEGIAFNFCKAATILLITLPFQKFALPLVAGAAAVFFLLAHFSGKTDTRCIMRVPLLIAAFWGAISVVSLFFTLRGMFAQ